MRFLNICETVTFHSFFTIHIEKKFNFLLQFHNHQSKLSAIKNFGKHIFKIFFRIQTLFFYMSLFIFWSAVCLHFDQLFVENKKKSFFTWRTWSASCKASLARYRSRFIFTSSDSGMSGTTKSINLQIPNTTC